MVAVHCTIVSPAPRDAVDASTHVGVGKARRRLCGILEGLAKRSLDVVGCAAGAALVIGEELDGVVCGDTRGGQSRDGDHGLVMCQSRSRRLICERFLIKRTILVNMIAVCEIETGRCLC